MNRKILLFFAFLTLSLWGFGQATINCFPDAEDLNTGTTDGVEFTETSLIDILAGGPQGWARLNIDQIPAGATIQTVTLHLYITADNNAWWQIMELADDPLLGDAASVFADITDGDIYYLHQSNFPEPGWFIVDLGVEAVADLQTNLDDEEGWFGVGVYEYESSTYAITCDGWAEDNPPFVEVSYLVPGAPMPPYNPYPPHASFSVDVEADLTWDFGDATLTYDLYFGTDFPPTTKVVEDEPSAASGSYDPGTMEYTTMYYWQVVAKNDADLETPGPVWNFTTACDAWDVPILEDFDGITTPNVPYCWTGIVNSTSAWAAVETVTWNGINNTQCIHIGNDNDPAAETILVSPELEGGAAGKYANFWLFGYTELSVGTMSDPADPSTYTEWTTVTPTSVWMDYIEIEVFFTNYTGTDTYIAFKGIYSANWQDLYIDDMLIDVAPTCPKPSDLYVNLTATNSAVVGWTENGDATQWNIEYDEYGFTPTGEPTITVNENPAGISGLLPGTTYEFYVRSDCGGGEFSYWVGPMQFQTMCVASDVPYFENFEDVEPPTAPPCILVENTNMDNLEWYTATLLPEYSIEGEQAFRIDYTYNNSMDDWFFSAPLNLLGGENYIVQFYYTSNSTGWTEKLEVKWGTEANSAYMTSDQIFADTNIAYGYEWHEANAYFSPDEDGVYYVGWHGFSIPGQYFLFVDAITIDVAPTCLKPSNVYVDSVATDAASIGWFENGDATMWNLEYVYAGDAPTGNANVFADSNPFTITGLESGTDYDVYVQADCGGGDVSWWSISKAFTTLCDAELVPIEENFDGVIAPELPDCWRTLEQSSGNAYINTVGWDAYSAPNALYMYSSNDADATLIAISPSVADDGDGLAGKWVRFYAWGSCPELAVGTISNPYDPSTFNAISVVPLSNQWLDYQEYEVYFTNYTGPDEMIAFKGVFSGTYQSVYIDNVLIDHPPSCPKPTDQAVSDITTNSAMLEWSENGVATTWHIEYGYEGFMPSGDPMLTVYENPYELMNLESGTSYDWYVQAFCEVGDTSEWQGPHNFITLCEPFDVPTMENFDGVTSPEIPPCWSTLVNSTSQWAEVTTITWQNYSAPNALQFYNSDDMSAELYAISPMMIDPVDELWINFFASGATPYLVLGVMTDPLDASTFTAVDSVMLTGNWQEHEVFFDEYVGAGMFIAMKPSYIGGWQNVYVDDIVIDHPPTCPKPSDLYAEDLTQSSAMLGWEENGTATAWNIEWDYAGFTPTGVANAFADANPFLLTDLEDGTFYEFYVQADCGGGDESYWVGPYLFQTLCFPTVLAMGEYIEDFENITPPLVPPCIAVENTNIDDIFWQGSFDNPYTGISHMMIGYTFNNPMDDWFFSAPLELIGGQTYNVQFYYTNYSISYPEKLEVLWGTEPNSDAMTSDPIFVDELINYGPDDYQEAIVNFTPEEDGVYFVGWHGFSDAGMWDLYVDDIMIEWDNSLVVVATATPDTICEGAESQLNGSGVGGSGNYNYAWTSNPAGFTSSDPDPIVSPTETTDYILEINDGFVSIYDTVTVHVKQLPAQPTSPTGITFVCSSWGSSTYSTTSTSGANWFDWVLDPVEAGDLTGTGTSVTVLWNQGWLGNCTLTVTGMHDECAGPESDALNIMVYLPDVQLPNFDTACIQWAAFELTGGTPAGGVYTGPGVDDDGWFDPAVAGVGTHTITYTYSDAAACENYDTALMIVDACVGIGDYSSNVNVVVTPNPNNGIFTLKVSSANAEKVNVKVLNNFGEEVYNDNNVELHRNYSTEIDLSAYAKGLYYLYIYSDHVNYVEKIIVK